MQTSSSVRSCLGNSQVWKITLRPQGDDVVGSAFFSPVFNRGYQKVEKQIFKVPWFYFSNLQPSPCCKRASELAGIDWKVRRRPWVANCVVADKKRRLRKFVISSGLDTIVETTLSLNELDENQKLWHNDKLKNMSKVITLTLHSSLSYSSTVYYICLLVFKSLWGIRCSTNLSFTHLPSFLEILSPKFA